MLRISPRGVSRPYPGWSSIWISKLTLEIQCKAYTAAARADCKGSSPFLVIIVCNTLEHILSAAIDRDSCSKTSEADTGKKSATFRLSA